MDIIERLEDDELYVDAVDDAITEIKRLRARTAWRPIETAPKDGTLVDLWVVYSGQKGIRLFNMQWREWAGAGGYWKCKYSELTVSGDVVKNWRPVPEPPGQGE